MSAVRPACPSCKSRDTVSQGNAKQGPDGSTIRRRICRTCKRRFKTKEAAATVRCVIRAEWS